MLLFLRWVRTLSPSGSVRMSQCHRVTGGSVHTWGEGWLHLAGMLGQNNSTKESCVRVLVYVLHVEKKSVVFI